MTKRRALAIAVFTAFFFVPAGLLVLGFEGLPTSSTVRGFGTSGLIQVWWGRAALAAFFIFIGVLLLLPRVQRPKK
jgi:hypothetical protein